MSKEKHPWSEFLESRKKALKWARDKQGHTIREIKEMFSMDVEQVREILKYADEDELVR